MADKMNITLYDPNPARKKPIELENFTSYSFSSDLYELADFAEVTVPYETGAFVEPGYQIRASVTGSKKYPSGVLVFAGIVDGITHEYNKTAHNVSLTCRDYSAFLVDEYCSVFKDYTSGTALQIYNDLIDNVSALKFKNLRNEDGPLFSLLNETDLATALITSLDPFKVGPGDTVAGKLQELATRIGVDFHYLEDGTVLFGKLDEQRRIEKLMGISKYSINMTEAKPNISVKSCTYTHSLSGRYSKIRVFGQTQTGRSVYSTTYDNSLLWNKFMIVNFNDVKESLVARGVEIREQQREAGFELEYNVIGHIQRGEPWQINREVDVNDTVLGLKDTYVVNSRTMTYIPANGTETYLRLGLIKDYVNDPPPPPTGNVWRPV